MNTRIVLTGIMKDNDEFLVVKINENEDLYPGAWEFPGGHLEKVETLKDVLKRKLYEKIGFDLESNPRTVFEIALSMFLNCSDET